MHHLLDIIGTKYYHVAKIRYEKRGIEHTILRENYSTNKRKNNEVRLENFQ